MGKQVWKPGNMLYPLPAVMVSCGREGEKPNIITIAWAGTVCSDPAMVSISVRPSRYSYQIIRETGEFVINLVTRELTFAMDHCGVRSGRDTDKFREMKLTAQPANKVKAPLIAESPVNIECRVQQVLELGSHHMFLASVEAVDVDEAYLDSAGKLHLNDADLTAYSHGTYYSLGEALGTFGYSVRRKAAGQKVLAGSAGGIPEKSGKAAAKKSAKAAPGKPGKYTFGKSVKCGPGKLRKSASGKPGKSAPEKVKRNAPEKAKKNHS